MSTLKEAITYLQNSGNKMDRTILKYIYTLQEKIKDLKIQIKSKNKAIDRLENGEDVY